MIYMILLINNKTKQSASIQINSEVPYEELKERVIKPQSRYVKDLAKQCNLDLRLFDELRFIPVPEESIPKDTGYLYGMMYTITTKWEKKIETLFIVSNHPTLLSDQESLHEMIKHVLTERGLLETAEDCYTFNVT